MFRLFRPSDNEIRKFLDDSSHDTFSYTDVGATSDDARPPVGYNIDRNRQHLGNGNDVFDRAKAAIRTWKMFDVPAMELCFPNTPIEPGRNVAPLAYHLGFYSLNSCRIVYVIDEPSRFGFAYGTLTQHAETGEERFIVELEEESGDVWYDVYAFSLPASLLVKLGYPYSRYRQKKFGADSKAAMLRAVTEGSRMIK